METRQKISGDGNAREEILASIRQSLAASEPLDEIRRQHRGPAESHSDSERLITSSISQEALLENFRINLESVGGHCMVVQNEREASNCVRDLIERTPSKRVAVSNSALVGRIVGPVDSVDSITDLSTDTLFECDLGITGAQWAIAETGTLVLESDVETHRLISLVPPVHLCVVKGDRIRQTLGEILELTSKDLSRTITFITGASRTSDIELTLAIGVHGPAELHVIVIAD